MNPTTDPTNASENEHDDERGGAARAGEKQNAADEYTPKTSNVYGHARQGDYFPADESGMVTSAPAPADTGGFLTCDVSTFGADGVTVDVFKE